MLLKAMLVYSPVAVMSLLLTCTVISVDDGLLRTSTGCTVLLPSSTVYFDWLKCTVFFTRINIQFIVILSNWLWIKNNCFPHTFYSCNMGTSDLSDMCAQSLRAAGIYISGKSQVPMLQLLCNTSSKADNLNVNTSVITRFFLYACLKGSIMARCG